MGERKCTFFLFSKSAEIHEAETWDAGERFSTARKDRWKRSQACRCHESREGSSSMRLTIEATDCQKYMSRKRLTYPSLAPKNTGVNLERSFISIEALAELEWILQSAISSGSLLSRDSLRLISTKNFLKNRIEILQFTRHVFDFPFQRRKTFSPGRTCGFTLGFGRSKRIL